MAFKSLIALPLLVCFSIKIIAQKNPCANCVYLDLLKRCLFFNAQNDTVYIELDNQFYLKALIKNCKGDLYFEKRKSRDSVIFLSGFYKATENLRRRQVQVPDLDGHSPGIDTKKIEYHYYKPRRSGLWKFYDINGVLVNSKWY